MSLQIFIQDKRFINLKYFNIVFFMTLILLASSAQADWNVDFSRRSKEIRKTDYDQPENMKKDKSVFDTIFESTEPIQEIVVLNTEKGFIPKNLRVRTGRRYRVHIVNINPKNKNVSFILDSFSEHHATYFGQQRSFIIQPKTTGVYTFQCPETSAQGKLVVYPQASTRMRLPASEH